MAKKILTVEIDEENGNIEFNYSNINFIERAGIINILQLSFESDYVRKDLDASEAKE